MFYKSGKEFLWKDDPSDSREDIRIVAIMRTVLASYQETSFSPDSEELKRIASWIKPLFSSSRADLSGLSTATSIKLNVASKYCDSVLAGEVLSSKTEIDKIVVYLNDVFSASKYTIRDC